MTLAERWRRGAAFEVRESAVAARWSRRWVTASRKNINVWASEECGTRGAAPLVQLKIKSITSVCREIEDGVHILGLEPLGVELIVVASGSTQERHDAIIAWERALNDLLGLHAAAPPPPVETAPVVAAVDDAPPPPPPAPPAALEATRDVDASATPVPALAAAPAAAPTAAAPTADAPRASAPPPPPPLAAALEGFIPLVTVRPPPVTASASALDSSAAYARIEGALLVLRPVRPSMPAGLFADHSAGTAVSIFDLRSVSQVDALSTSVTLDWRGGAPRGGETLELRAASESDARRWRDALLDASSAPSAGSRGGGPMGGSGVAETFAALRARCAALQTQASASWLPLHFTRVLLTL